MFRRLLKFFKHPQLMQRSVARQALHGALDEKMSPDEKRHAENMEELNSASLNMQHEALQHNLDIAHTTMIIALIAVIISLAIGIFAIISKPHITVQVIEPKTSQAQH